MESIDDKTRYRLVAVDIDHTLLRSDGTVSEHTRRMIARCAEQGVGFTLATGRMYCSALPIARDLGLTLPLVTYQGALLKDPEGQVLRSLSLDDAAAREIETMLRRSGLHYNIYAGEELYFSTFGQRFLDYARHIGVAPLHAPAGLDGIEVTQFGVFAEPEKVAALEQAVTERFGDTVRTVISGGHFLEICHPQAQKSQGLAVLAAHLGIDRREIIAVGDNNNDLDMLRYAGLGVAVGNAVPSAKAAADRVIASNDEDGVARLLEEIVR